VNALNIKAEQTLREEIEKVHAIEKAQAVKLAEMEAEHVVQTERIERANTVNRTLAVQLGGLRDPGRRPCRQSPVSSTTPSAGEPVDRSADSRLSAEASEFLLAFAHDADRAALYAFQCRAFIQELVGPLENDETATAPSAVPLVSRDHGLLMGSPDSR